MHPRARAEPPISFLAPIPQLAPRTLRLRSGPDRHFKTSKLHFLSHLVRESLLTPTRGTQHKPLSAEPGTIAITWIGHSSFLVEAASRRILIDPVFATFLIALKRRRRPGIRIRDLPPVDTVLLTHAHMDHLNLPSLRAIVRNNRRLGAAAPAVIVPRGVEGLVDRLGFRALHTLDAWQTVAVDGLQITLTPARHWGARFFNDTYRGYGGYMLTVPEGSIYHAGDTASFPGFAEIGARFHPEIAMLPIGAYFPDSFRSVHTSPEDALAAFEQLGSRVLIPMHYGSFRLSLEPMDEPPQRLLKGARALGIQEQMVIMEEGRTHMFAMHDAWRARASDALQPDVKQSPSEAP